MRKKIKVKDSSQYGTAKASSTSPPGGYGSWQLTPDQFDRNSEWSRRDWERRKKKKGYRPTGGGTLT